MRIRILLFRSIRIRIQRAKTKRIRNLVRLCRHKKLKIRTQESQINADPDSEHRLTHRKIDAFRYDLVQTKINLSFSVFPSVLWIWIRTRTKIIKLDLEPDLDPQ